MAEAFRVLRANLRFANLDGNGQMILVTSALPNEGKTLTAVNLAQSLAATGQTVLLIDCDLRSPNVASNLGLENGVGMLSVLLNQVPLGEAIQADVSGLDVLPTGPAPPEPLGGARDGRGRQPAEQRAGALRRDRDRRAADPARC